MELKKGSFGANTKVRCVFHLKIEEKIDDPYFNGLVNQLVVMCYCYGWIFEADIKPPISVTIRIFGTKPMAGQVNHS